MDAEPAGQRHIPDADTARKVYRLLADRVGAHPRDEEAFVAAATRPQRWTFEWRFQGTLGFGGKFYADARRWRVGCYPEDRTDQRDQDNRTVNDQLDRLRTRAAV